MKRPSSLKRGDRVAIIFPSSEMPFRSPWVYEQGIECLKNIFQLESVEFPTALQSPENLSENLQARAEDINKAFSDPSIKAII